MKERTTYIGTLKGVKGIWCDKKPRGLEVDKTITWYSADEGKVFTKDGELFDTVNLKEGESINDYIEIKDPRPSEEPKEENNEERNAE